MFEKHEADEELNIKSQRRRSSSIFYVPLLSGGGDIDNNKQPTGNNKDRMSPPPCGFNWSMTGSDVNFEDEDDDYTYPEKKALPPPPSTPKPENKRYGVLIGTLNDSTNTIASNHSINNRNDEQNSNNHHNLDDYDDSEISRIQTNTSTPIVQMKSRSRNNILSVSNTSSSLSSPKRLTIKEKSSTLPQASSNATAVADNAINTTVTAAAAALSYSVDTFPPKSKVTTAVVSSPIVSNQNSSRKYSHSDTSIISTNAATAAVAVSPNTNQSKKPLSFIRRTHSTKVARSNSILKTFTTTKGILSSSSGDNMPRIGNQHAEHEVHHLPFELLDKILCSDVCGELLKSYFVKRSSFTDQNNSSLGEFLL